MDRRDRVVAGLETVSYSPSGAGNDGPGAGMASWAMGRAGGALGPAGTLGPLSAFRAWQSFLSVKHLSTATRSLFSPHAFKINGKKPL